MVVLRNVDESRRVVHRRPDDPPPHLFFSEGITAGYVMCVPVFTLQFLVFLAVIFCVGFDLGQQTIKHIACPLLHSKVPANPLKKH